jgi:hypothetical protein
VSRETASKKNPVSFDSELFKKLEEPCALLGLSKRDLVQRCVESVLEMWATDRTLRAVPQLVVLLDAADDHKKSPTVITAATPSSKTQAIGAVPHNPLGKKILGAFDAKKPPTKS